MTSLPLPSRTGVPPDAVWSADPDGDEEVVWFENTTQMSHPRHCSRDGSKQEWHVACRTTNEFSNETPVSARRGSLSDAIAFAENFRCSWGMGNENEGDEASIGVCVDKEGRNLIKLVTTVIAFSMAVILAVELAMMKDKSEMNISREKYRTFYELDENADLSAPPSVIPDDLDQICSEDYVSSGKEGFHLCRSLCEKAECCFVSHPEALSCSSEDVCIHYEEICAILDADLYPYKNGEDVEDEIEPFWTKVTIFLSEFFGSSA